MNIIAFVILVLFGTSCTMDNTNNTKCAEYNKKSADLIYQYYLSNDSTKLDSALTYTEIGIARCDSLGRLLGIRKLGILSLKKEYGQALDFIPELDQDPAELPYYFMLLRERFRAMKAQSEGNSIDRNMSLNLIIEQLGGFVQQHKDEIDSLFAMNNTSAILSDPLSTAITQWYYYRAQIEGKDPIKRELEARELKLGGNQEFYIYLNQTLNEDFMTFSGI